MGLQDDARRALAEKRAVAVAQQFAAAEHLKSARQETEARAANQSATFIKAWSNKIDATTAPRILKIRHHYFERQLYTTTRFELDGLALTCHFATATPDSGDHGKIGPPAIQLDDAKLVITDLASLGAAIDERDVARDRAKLEKGKRGKRGTTRISVAEQWGYLY